MPANRFYYPGPLNQGATIELRDTEHHHLRVMRASVDEEVEIVNGKGALATAKITALQKESTQLLLLKVSQEAPLEQEIILIIPLMRPNKLEWIVEKATELGATALHFYAAEFSEKMQLSEHQLERLQNLCLSALKQSGRLFLPHIELVPSLERAMVEEGTYLFGDTTPKQGSILDVQVERRTALITGPERGFSPKERAFLIEKAQPVSLSAHILRAETAPVAGLAVLALKL
jgi:16S rRNA (uracil1498-N3)-methyltransferase